MSCSLSHRAVIPLRLMATARRGQTAFVTLPGCRKAGKPSLHKISFASNNSDLTKKQAMASGALRPP